MNPLAQELNDQLKDCATGRLLSELGKKMFFPKGIVAQSAEATQKAHKLNATIGMAYKNRQAFQLPLLSGMLPALSSSQAVAYAPTGGVLELRERWKKEQLAKNPLLESVETGLPVVVSGLTSGIFQMAELFINPGDRIIIPDMYWGNYRLIIGERREGVVDSFPFFNAAGGFNLEAFDRQLGQSLSDSKKSGGSKRGKVILLLNFPNNPTGYSPTQSEAETMTEIVKRHAKAENDILTVHDDAYFGLFYDETIYRQSLFARFANLHENLLALKVDGATKEDYAWGFRVGFMTFAARNMDAREYGALNKKLMGSIRSTVSNSPGISQHLLVQIMNHPDYTKQKQEAEKDLNARYHMVKTLLANAYQDPGREELKNILTPLPFNSGYFMTFKVETISAEDLRLSLLEKGTGSIAIGNDYLRIAFAAIDKDDLESLYSEIFQTARDLHSNR